MQIHSISPVYDKNSKVLILGSFPSVKSREINFFYGHPQNRFWKVLSIVLGENEPKSIEEKKSFLLKNNIAVWDVISSCEIVGSSDSTIKNVTVNDLSLILSVANIENIFVNGKMAEKYYKEYLEKKLNRKAIVLPSTSPANAVYGLDKLVSEWKVIKKSIKVFVKNDYM